MATPRELEEKFWKSLRADMTLMLGLSGVDGSHARPMTAQLEEEDRGPIWFFTAKDTGIVQALGQRQRAFAAYSSKTDWVSGGSGGAGSPPRKSV